MSRGRVFTKELLELQNAIKKGEKEEFIEKFRALAPKLYKNGVRSNYLDQLLLICYQAIEEFILEDIAL